MMKTKYRFNNETHKWEVILSIEEYIDLKSKEMALSLMPKAVREASSPPGLYPNDYPCYRPSLPQIVYGEPIIPNKWFCTAGNPSYQTWVN